MEIEKRPPEIAKKLWNIVRIVFYMMRRSKAKRKIMVELDMLLKKGKNAGKAISNLILHHHHHYSALTCRSADANTAFVSPREVEFSCSNTPLYPSYHSSKRKNQHHYGAEELEVMHKVFGILSRYDVVVEAAAAAASPLAGLPGFGRSPAAARQLRVTDSPFSTKEAEVNDHDHHLQVDKDAEEFIKKFYTELKKQKPTALESPSPYHEWATYLR